MADARVVAQTEGASRASDAGPLLQVQDLKKYFPLRQSFWAAMRGRDEGLAVRAVDGVTFDLARGESLGLAGESGCGKTTTGKLVLKLVEPTSGDILFNGRSLRELSGSDLKAFRRRAQLMFQNPYEALNPRFTIYRSLLEPLLIHGIGDAQEREERVFQALERVHLSPPDNYLSKYPHQLSGGQLQRVVLARALVLEPAFLVADEPVSMLDVSVRAGILNLMREMRRDLNLAVIYISHDLSLIQYMCERTAIMYLGRIVEMGPTQQVIGEPLHPYTQALVSAVPVPDPHHRAPALRIKDTVPTPIHLPPGCRFQDRCPHFMPVCREPVPQVQRDGRLVECHLYA